MALLAAWLGLPGALLALALAPFSDLGCRYSSLRPLRATAPKPGRSKVAAGHISLHRRNRQQPLGTAIIHAYLRWAGFLSVT